MGGVRSARAPPGGFAVEYRFDEDERSAWTVIRKPSDRGFLTRSDGGPRRAEHWLAPDRMGDFSPCLLRFAVRPRGTPPSGPERPKPLLRTPTLRRPTHPAPSNPADGHSPLDHPRKPQRSPYVRPSLLSGEIRIRAVWRVGISLVENFQGVEIV
jgi:hypothetical protein